MGPLWEGQEGGSLAQGLQGQGQSAIGSPLFSEVTGMYTFSNSPTGSSGSCACPVPGLLLSTWGTLEILTAEGKDKWWSCPHQKLHLENKDMGREPAKPGRLPSGWLVPGSGRPS